MENNDFKDIEGLIDKYQNWYWTSDFDDINLIDDLRLNSQIYETAHSRVLFKLFKAGKRYGYPLWQEFSKRIGLYTITANSFGPPEKYNIDLLVEGVDSTNKKIGIIIENKINGALDQDKQIQRYINSLEIKESLEEKQIYVIYITRYNDSSGPSDNSFPLEMKERFGNRYYKISYEVEIRSWINNCKDIWLNDMIRSALTQYGCFLNNLFEPNKEKEKVMIDNIEKWCFEGDSSSKTLSEINSSLDQKKRAMNELQSQMDLFYRNAVIKKMEEAGLEVQPNETAIHYVCFKVEYFYNGSTIKLNGHVNFREDYDGNRIWFGIETDFAHKSIKLFHDKRNNKECIEGNDAQIIMKKIKEIVLKIKTKSTEYINDNSPYLCWKYSSLDEFVQEILIYCESIKNSK